MKEYYYLVGQAKMGPYSLEDLLKQPISRDTKVWYSGLPDWVDAVDMPEFANFFASAPPPPPPSSTAPPAPRSTSMGGSQRPSAPMPKNWLIESILVTLFCCLPFGIAGIVFASRVESRYYAGDLDGAEYNAREAAKWTKIGFFVGLSGVLHYFLFIFFAAFFGLANSSEFDNY
ncbi:MAG: CD225/dispanin family protein [Saprospiraceae bacterium]|nr:CD225/dispanin family protein [Saprospiraceae bacterium]